MDYSLESLFDYNQTHFCRSGDDGKWSLVHLNFEKIIYIYITICFIIDQEELMDCSVVIHSICESERSGRVLSQYQRQKHEV